MIRLEYPQPQQNHTNRLSGTSRHWAAFRGLGIISTRMHAHTHSCITLETHIQMHACTNRPGKRIIVKRLYGSCQQILMAHTNSHFCALCCCFFPPPFLSCTLRQLCAELLRRQAGKQAHQQWGRGAFSLMSSKAVNTRIDMRSCITCMFTKPKIHSALIRSSLRWSIFDIFRSCISTFKACYVQLVVSKSHWMSHIFAVLRAVRTVFFVVL